MPQEYVRATGINSLNGAAETMTIPEAARAVGRSSRFVADAIRKERAEPGTGLRAFIPTGRSFAGGKGHAYQIRKADLEAWWFGEEQGHAK